MQFPSRFTVALQIFACAETYKDRKMTSDFLAESVQTNPVIIRTILSMLTRAGLISVKKGTGGIQIVHPLNEITFYDVFCAVGCMEENELFHFHERPNPECTVGKNIHALLDDKLAAVQTAMEDELKRYTLEDLRSGMQDLLQQEQ